MLNGNIPPFKIGEKRSFIYKDSVGGASPLEWFGLLSMVLIPVLLFV